MPARNERSELLCPVVDAAMLEPYGAGRAARGVDLYLDANEGAPPPEHLLEAVRAIDPNLLRRYPNTSPLEARIAEARGVSPERVIVTAGGDDSIDRCCRLMLDPGRRMIVSTPSFEMIGRSARLRGAAIDEIPWDEGPFPSEDFVRTIEQSTAVIAVVTPNNPTGTVAQEGDLQRLSRSAPHALLLVDLAYTEFADEDLTAAALKLPNAIAIRTFSKVAGLAGLRVGYALGPPGIIRWLRAVGGPYPTSALSLQLAARWMDCGQEASATYINRVREEREALVKLFQSLGVRALRSQANFVLAFFNDADRIRRTLLDDGIAVRRFRGPSSLRRALRITCPGDDDDFERLCTALRRAISKEIES